MNQKENIIVLFEWKGGTGESTTVVNSGISLARQGKRILLVDVDARESLTASLGYQQSGQMEITLATVLSQIIMEEPLPRGYDIIHHAKGVGLLHNKIKRGGLTLW